MGLITKADYAKAVRAATPAGYWVDANAQIRRTTPRVGRNEPCHCGSGDKFKHCHGKPE